MMKNENDRLLVVGIKLCGHCSPRRDMMTVTAALKKAAPDLDFVFSSRVPVYDLLLVLNACESACAERPENAGPMIVVTPDTVDFWPVDGRDLVQVILEKIRDIGGGE